MLSDDVENAAGQTVSKTGAVIGGTIRGGLMGGALTFLTGALGLGAASAVGATGGAMAAAGAAVTGTITGAAFMIGAGLPLILAGAAVGAALLGIGSLIPGVSDMWKGAKKHMQRRQEQPAPAPEVIVEHHHHYSPPPQPQQTKRVIICDNPDFQPGRGAAMAEKGDSAQPGANVCR